MEKNLAALFEFLAELRIEDLSKAVLERARMNFLDNLGCILLGRDLLGAAAIAQVAARNGGGSEATILTAPARPASATGAAIAHASFINQTELSEGVARACVHPGTVIVPALLAVGERDELSGASLVLSLVAGWEALVRIGWTLTRSPGDDPSVVRPHLVVRDHLYPPSMLGSLGSAVAVGVATGAHAEQLYQSVGMASCLIPSVPLRILESGATAKGFLCGWGSGLGVHVADLAAAGVTGLPDFGTSILERLSPKPDASVLVDRLGDRYEIMNSEVKFFAVAVVMTEVECALQFSRRFDIKWDEVESILLQVNRRAKLLDVGDPVNRLAAKFNLRYCAAQALLAPSREWMIEGAFTQAAFDDPRWRAIAATMSVQAVDEFDRALETYPPKARPSRMTVTMRDGSTRMHQIEDTLGLAHKPPVRADYVSKFRVVAEPRLGGARAEEVIAMVDQLEDLSSVTALVEALRD